MSEVIVERPVDRPRGTTVGINERLDRYRISELMRRKSAYQ